MRSFVCATAVLGAIAGLRPANPTLAAQTPTPVTPLLRWSIAPALFPRGAGMAVVSGNPIEAESYAVLLSMPDGYRLPPHTHTRDEHVEVKQGVFLVGVGDKMDLGKVRTLVAGDTATAPAGVPHYAAAKGATIILVSGRGPYVMSYLNPRDEQWRPFPYGY